MGTDASLSFSSRLGGPAILLGPCQHRRFRADACFVARAEAASLFPTQISCLEAKVSQVLLLLYWYRSAFRANRREPTTGAGFCIAPVTAHPTAEWTAGSRQYFVASEINSEHPARRPASLRRVKIVSYNSGPVCSHRTDPTVVKVLCC
jgi:hypothetical protein